MLVLLAATQLLYAFPVDKPVSYQVQVSFDGYVQVFGGKDSKVEVDMDVEATGVEPDEERNPRVSSEIRKVKLMMNGSELPIEPKNLTRFFPKTTITMTSLGKMLKTDAPDVKLPVRLPGLHVKRFPDITYLPIEFPAAGIEVDAPFVFKKPFGDSDVEYTVTPKEITDGAVQLDLKIKQAYTQFEDKFGNPVDEKDGVVKVSTEVEGKGSATFNRKRGIVDLLRMDANAMSKATDMKTSKATERKLRTLLNVKAKE